MIIAAAGHAVGKQKAPTKRPAAHESAVASDPRTEDRRLAAAVEQAVVAYVGMSGVASREKETLAAMAAVVGERCQEAAAEYPVRAHELIAGQRIFSDKINVLLAGNGNTLELGAIPAESVYGQIRDQVDSNRFSKEKFPRLVEVFRSFTGRVGHPEDWGKVPLSLPVGEWPRLLPLRVAFDLRKGVDAVLRPIAEDQQRSLRVCTLALTTLLNGSDYRIEPRAALVLVLETINGMAKTAPMLKAIAAPTEAMRQAQHDVIKVGGP